MLNRLTIVKVVSVGREKANIYKKPLYLRTCRRCVETCERCPKCTIFAERPQKPPELHENTQIRWYNSHYGK